MFICVLGYSVFNIVTWYIDGKDSKKILDDLEDVVIENNDTVDDDKPFTVDFDKLKEKNNEVVAFVKVNGTDIEYSVVKHNDNSYYLTHSFDKSYNKYGWIFANYHNKFVFLLHLYISYLFYFHHH